MPFYLGNTEIQNAYLGSSLIQGLYLGDTQFWPIVSPTSSIFNFGTGFNGTVSDFINTSGSLLVIGTFTLYSGSNAQSMVRIQPNGEIDNTFSGSAGYLLQSTGDPDRLLELSDGSYIMGTSYINNVGNIIKVNNNGIIDKTFITGSWNYWNGKAFTSATDIKYINNNVWLSVLYGTPTVAINYGLLKVNATTGATSTFPWISQYGVSCIYHDSINSRVLVATYNGATWGIKVLTEAGVLTTTWNLGLNNIIRKIERQSTGKYIIVGDFTGNIVRINNNGSIDTTFNSGGVGANSSIRDFEVLSDDGIICGGLFTTYNGTISNRIAKLTSNGALDNTFVIGSGFNSTVQEIDLVDDNLYTIGGDFTTYNGTTANKIIQLTNTGAIAS